MRAHAAAGCCAGSIVRCIAPLLLLSVTPASRALGQSPAQFGEPILVDDHLLFDLVFAGIAHAAMGHHRTGGGVETGAAGQELGGVGLCPARLAVVV